MLLLAIVFILVFSLHAFMLARNNKVFSERLNMVKLIDNQTRYEIINNNLKDNNKYWELYDNSPSYDEMMFKFWKSVNSFWCEELSNLKANSSK